MRCNMTFSHMMPVALVLPSQDASGIVSGTTAFPRSRQSKWSERYLLLVMWYHWHHEMQRASPMSPLHSLNQDNQNELQHHLFGHVSPLVLASVTWHWCWHPVMPMAPLHSFSQDNWNEGQHDFLVKWSHWHWHHMMHVALSMAPFHSLGEDDWNEVQHDLFGHVITLALTLASHYALDNQHWHHMMLTALSIDSLHSLCPDSWNGVKHNFFGHVMPLASHDAASIGVKCCKFIGVSIMQTASSVAPLHSLDQKDQWGVIIPFLVMWHQQHQHWHHPQDNQNVVHMIFSLCDATCTVVSITWCGQQLQCHQCIP